MQLFSSQTNKRRLTLMPLQWLWLTNHEITKTMAEVTARRIIRLELIKDSPFSLKQARSLSLSLSLYLSLSHSLTHSHTHMHTCTHSLSLSFSLHLSHTNTHIHSLSHTHTYTHTTPKSLKSIFISDRWPCLISV